MEGARHTPRPICTSVTGSGLTVLAFRNGKEAATHGTHGTQALVVGIVDGDDRARGGRVRDVRVGGGSPPPDRSPHLLVVPTTATGRAALSVSAARTVAGYKAFTLVEATGDDVAALQRAGASVRDDMREVKIGSRSVDPAVERPSLMDKTGANLRTAGKGGSGLAVVQYVGPLKDKWTTAVRQACTGGLLHGAERPAGRR